ncbi:MAG: hypothetical protein ACRDWT_14275 [Jatrophihabitantaceae bacterium]
MDLLQMALMVTKSGWTDEARSALPNAPVIPYVERVRVVPRARARAAGVLHRLADRVSPSVPTGRAARGLSTCSGVQAH